MEGYFEYMNARAPQEKHILRSCQPHASLSDADSLSNEHSRCIYKVLWSRPSRAWRLRISSGHARWLRLNQYAHRLSPMSIPLICSGVCRGYRPKQRPWEMNQPSADHDFDTTVAPFRISIMEIDAKFF